MFKLSCFLIGERHNVNLDALSRRKITMEGLALLIPTSLWFFNGFSLSYVALNQSLGISIGVGICCALLIYSVDRLLLMSPKSNLMTISRFFLTVATSYVGGISGDLIIYAEDLNNSLSGIYDTKMRTTDKAFDSLEVAKKEPLLASIKQKQRKADSLQVEYNIEGAKGGYKDKAKHIEAQWNIALNDLSNAQSKVDELQQSYEGRRTKYRDEHMRHDNGISLRMSLLHKIVTNDWLSVTLFVSITLILGFAEGTVLLIKHSLSKTTTPIDWARAQYMQSLGI